MSERIWNGLACTVVYVFCICVILYGSAALEAVKSDAATKKENDIEWKEHKRSIYPPSIRGPLDDAPPHGYEWQRNASGKWELKSGVRYDTSMSEHTLTY